MLPLVQRHRIARSIVAVIAAGFIQVGLSSPAIAAAAPIKPTISSVTSDGATFTVSMVTAGSDALLWKWKIERRTVSGCANPYGDDVITTTGSLVSSFLISGVTPGCTYSIKVAGFNVYTGEFAEAQKVAGNYINGLRIYTKNEVGLSAAMTRTPFTTGLCGGDTATVAKIDWDYLATGPAGCNTDGFTSYYSGYIKAPFTGSVTFRNSSDDGFYLNIQGQNVIAYTLEGVATAYNSSGSISMVANEVYRFEAWHHEYNGNSAAKLFWEWSGQATTIVPQANFGTDPSVLGVGCPLGLAERCAAGSAVEIKKTTGTNMDGMYWIVVNGTPTLTYSIMNSAMQGGGWMLAMKGKKSGSTLDYGDSLWTDASTLNDAYPERWKTGDTSRDVDAKYGVYAYNKGNQIMALYPEQTTYAGGATNALNATYGFSWIETTTSMRTWRAYDANASGGYPAGWGGNSAAVPHTGGPTATPTCVNTATTLSNLFSTASRCAFRQVSATYSALESPYSAIGNGLFYSQSQIRFFGINYGSASTGNRDRARFGFGWNENLPGDEGSNDGTSGIGIDRQGYSSITTGSINQCCETQGGISGVNDGTSTNIPFEMYTRNSTEFSVFGNNLRVTNRRTNTMVSGNTFSTSGGAGGNTFRISPLREGIFVDSSTGVVTVSESLGVGDYSSTISVTDSNGSVATRAFTVQVLNDSSETDTALSFNGTNQYVSTVGNYGLWGDQTYEAWVKAGDSCSQTDSNKVAFGHTYFLFFCNNGKWFVSFLDNSDAWAGKETNRVVVPNEWVHVAIVRSGTTVTAYFDYTQANFWNGSAWVSSYTQSTVKNGYGNHVVGGSGAANQYFKGEVDEVKVWDSARSLGDIVTSMNVLENAGLANLYIYWDFNEGSGSAISRSQRVDNNFNLTPSSSSQWTPIVKNSSVGPYTVVTIPRTVISTTGGWRVPANVTRATTLVVGGGGAGGTAGGGGGAGGYVYTPLATLTPGEVMPVTIGVGGPGQLTNTGRSGTSSTFNSKSGLGGGGGGSRIGTSNTSREGLIGGSGGGSSAGYGSTIATAGASNQFSGLGIGVGFSGGTGTLVDLSGGGGGGAGGAGGTSNSASGGLGGSGLQDPISNSTQCLAVGGGGAGVSANSAAGLCTNVNNVGTPVTGGGFGSFGSALPGNALPNTGSGGGGSGDTTVHGGNGGSGLVALRYLTAAKPTFTAPTNVFLNAGMTETFTTNVAQDSATALLTRTFRWESTTAGSGGTYSVIKQGTGAANASFSWVPSDTSTSGDQYLFRVIVTDSDTAGLFIQDTSTAVFATINRALVLNSKSTLTKTVNVSKVETFTVTLGTPTYRYTFTNSNPLITLDTSTVGSPRVRLADTLTVGTYYETFTVIDSVSATIVQPLTIIVSPPPSFSANAAQVDSGTALYLDAGNLQSNSGTGATWNDISGRGLTASFPPSPAPPMHNVTTGNLACSAPTFISSNLGTLDFNGSNCGYVPNVGLLKVYSYEVWVKRSDAMTDYSAVISNPWSGAANQQLAISLHWMANGNLQAGIFDGVSWNNVVNSPVINVGVWTHVAVTFSGSTLTMTLNGDTAGKLSVARTLTWVDAKNDTGILIGKRFDANTDYFKGSIGSVRIYNRVLTDAELLQNYNASKGRFLLTQNKQAVAGKYGTTVNETYTVTAGSETITAVFTSSAIAGLRWETSTVRSMSVQLQESLTAGTYNDTITVTDIYGSSTRLALTFTVAKADTLTVWIETPTALSYTGSAATFATPLRVTGLVSSDTGTAVSGITYRPGGTSCATGGVCAIGDIGPGGGIVFITPATASGNGRYFEAAPANWAGADDVSTAGKFCTGATNQDSISRSATQFGIGWGETNTALFEPYCTGGAVKLVSDYAGGGFTNWFIPNSNELIELAKVRNSAGLLGLGATWNAGRYGYWGSTESSATAMRTLVSVNNAWSIGATSKSDSANNMVRPVRMFSPCWTTDSCTAFASTTKPTDVGTYAISPAGLSLTTGDLSNYVAIKYETTTVTINRINQSSLTMPSYNPIYPDTATMYIGGGSGSGHLTFSVTSGGSATGCAFDYRKIYTTSIGTCNIQVVKAGDRNYLAETSTAVVYFLLYIINQPSNEPSGGSSIGLGGATAIIRDPNSAPNISSITFVPGYCSGVCYPEYWAINGAGFGVGDNLVTTVKFWRNKVLVMNQNAQGATHVVSDTLIIFSPSDIPAGATTGRITVTTPNGIAVSPEIFTIP